MLKTPAKTLSAWLGEHTGLSRTRSETLSWLVVQMARVGTVSLWRLAPHMTSSARIRSVHRRLERFFQYVRLDSGSVARLIVRIMKLQGSPWRLVLDRTNWKLGKCPLNILVLGVLHEGICIPLFWVVRHKAGNSNVPERIDLLQRLRDCFPGQPISCLIGDREFVGERWMSWLKGAGIPFVLRVKDNIHIWHENHEPVKLSHKLSELRMREKAFLKGKWYLGLIENAAGPGVRIAALRLKTGKLLILATTVHPRTALGLYRQRWGIETLFSCMKTRGLNLEATHMTQPEKLATLMSIAALGFCAAYKTGLNIARRVTLPIKSHGRRERSIFALGINALRKTMAGLQWPQISIYFKRLFSASAPLHYFISARL
jgi:hypothetical protein